jgi:hypothetical protein
MTALRAEYSARKKPGGDSFIKIRTILLLSSE